MNAPGHNEDALARLSRLVRPPDIPLEPGAPGAWAAVEAQLGTRLPADYQALIARYGSGVFDDFLYVLNPFAADPDGNLLTQLGVVLGGYRWLRDRVGGPDWLPAFPDPGGLLPAARTTNGDQLHWLTGGDPDDWPVVAFASRSNDPERHRFGLVELLADLFAGTLATRSLPAELAWGEHHFTPG